LDNKVSEVTKLRMNMLPSCLVQKWEQI